MDKRKIVRFTNKVALITAVILLYWVFFFTMSMVFGFRIFQKNITDLFLTSILSIIAIMSCTAIVNIMLNLSIISEAADFKAGITQDDKSKWRLAYVWGFVLSFPLICGMLYLGDMWSNHAKEKELVNSAEYLVKNNQKMLDAFSYNGLDSLSVDRIISTLGFLSKQDENLGFMEIIVQDKIDNKTVLLRFDNNERQAGKFNLSNYLYSCSAKEREYIEERYNNKTTKYLYKVTAGNYELHYPVETPKRMIIMHLTDYKRYGNYGS